MKSDLIETFKIVNFSLGRFFLNIPSQTRNLLPRLFQKLSLLTNLIFLLTEQYIFGANCLIRSKAAIVWKILKLNWMISEIMVRKETKRAFYRTIRWITLYHLICIVCVLGKDFFKASYDRKKVRCSKRNNK